MSTDGNSLLLLLSNWLHFFGNTMKSIHTILVACALLAGCNSSSAISGSELELFADACNSLKVQEKRKLCQVTLERLRSESRIEPDLKGAAKPQVTQASINFKDIPLGQAGVRAALTALCKQDKSNQPSSFDKKDRCEYQDARNIVWLSYGNLGHSLAIIELGEGDSLDSVEIAENKGAMLGLVEILRERYGAPKKTTKTVENKMGTKFDQEIFVWSDAQGNRITVESIYDKVDKGRVLIESAARIAARGVAEKLVKEAGKSNL